MNINAILFRDAREFTDGDGGRGRLQHYGVFRFV
jgi:hypothetical protein